MIIRYRAQALANVLELGKKQFASDTKLLSLVGPAHSNALD